MRVHVRLCARTLIATASLIFLPLAWPLTLEDLQNDSHLTPERFASYFSRFRFRFEGEVQSPETFLRKRAGDCDDFATLAARVLSAKGYTPQLVAVRMTGLVHVVCYIEETRSYLDYDLRSRKEQRSVACPGRLEAIAASVAARYRRAWTSVSEFTYSDGLKRLVETVINCSPDR